MLRRLLPPHWLVIALVAQLALAQRGQPLLASGWRALGLLPIVAGVALAMVAARRFAAAGTRIVPFTPSSALVTDGPFAFSRNPMYLGMLLVLAGVAVVLDRAAAWAVPVAFFVLIRQAFVLREERQMAATFGPAWDDYRRRVGRWVRWRTGAAGQPSTSSANVRS